MQRVLVAFLLAAVALTSVTACSSDDQPTTGVALPKDFPAADVPLIDGTVLSAEGSGNDWQVKVQAPASAGNGYTNATEKLTGAGYVESSRTDTDREKTVLLYREVNGKTLWVTVGISGSSAGGGATIIYSVSRL